jgi:hypothetical protein
MRKIFQFVVLSVVTLLIGTAICWATYFKQDFMSITKAEKKWPPIQLKTEQFKAADPSKRAPMAVDIVKRNLYVGGDMKRVRQELGDPDSYFFSDTIYAYQIMPFPGLDKENWHLVFIPDENLEKVKEVKIHKKCCYPSLF